MSAVDVKTAIERGDAGAVSSLPAAQPELVSTPIEWYLNQQNRSTPLHYVFDVFFNDGLEPGREQPLVEILIEAGAELSAPEPPHGDTPLITAASLRAEQGAIALLVAGASRRQMEGAGLLCRAGGDISQAMCARLQLPRDQKMVDALTDCGAP